jgi:hypothetical protein
VPLLRSLRVLFGSCAIVRFRRAACCAFLTFRFAAWTRRAEAIVLTSIGFALWICTRPDGCYSRC